tara:strand:+ start:117 stop:353 length:237 start_codon:yes stop_codon:yes gene_type:complete
MKAVVYSKDNCQWCDRVKQLFKSVDLDYIEYKYDEDFTKKEFQKEFGTDATFPQVSIGKKHIGGCKETLHYLQELKIL